MNFDKHYDQLYEQSAFARNESIEMKECEKCNGTGHIIYSECCGAEIIDGICQDIDCLLPCTEYKERCDECNGEGEIEI